ECLHLHLNSAAPPAPARQAADAVVGPAPVVLAGGGAPVGDGAACRAVRTADLAGAAITVVPTSAPALSADPALTTVGTVPRALVRRWWLRLPRGCGQVGPLVAAPCLGAAPLVTAGAPATLRVPLAAATVVPSTSVDFRWRQQCQRRHQNERERSYHCQSLLSV